MYGIATFEGAVLAPVYGWLVYRYGLRAPMVIATSMALVGFVVLYRLDSSFDFYVAFILVGLGFGIYYVAPLAAITNWFRRKRSLAMGITMVGSGLGGMLVPILVWALETYGWRLSFGLCALVVALICVPLCLLFRTHSEPYGLQVDGLAELEEQKTTFDAALEGRTYTVTEVACTWSFWAVVAIVAAG